MLHNLLEQFAIGGSLIGIIHSLLRLPTLFIVVMTNAEHDRLNHATPTDLPRRDHDTSEPSRSAALHRRRNLNCNELSFLRIQSVAGSISLCSPNQLGRERTDKSHPCQRTSLSWQCSQPLLLSLTCKPVVATLKSSELRSMVYGVMVFSPLEHQAF